MSIPALPFPMDICAIDDRDEPSVEAGIIKIQLLESQAYEQSLKLYALKDDEDNVGREWKRYEFIDRQSGQKVMLDAKELKKLLREQAYVCALQQYVDEISWNDDAQRAEFFTKIGFSQYMLNHGTKKIMVRFDKTDSTLVDVVQSIGQVHETTLLGLDTSRQLRQQGCENARNVVRVVRVVQDLGENVQSLGENVQELDKNQHRIERVQREIEVSQHQGQARLVRVEEHAVQSQLDNASKFDAMRASLNRILLAMIVLVIVVWYRRI